MSQLKQNITGKKEITYVMVVALGCLQEKIIMSTRETDSTMS